MLLASCTSTSDPTMAVVMPGYNTTATETNTSTSTKPATSTDSSLQVTAASAQASSTVMSEGDTPLPDQVAFLPVARPQATFPIPVPASAGTVAGNTPQPPAQPAQTAEETKAVAQQVAAGDAAVISKAQTQSKAQAQAAPVMKNDVYVTAGEPQQQPIAAPKKNLFASLFSTTPASAAPAPLVNTRSNDQPAQAKATPPAAKPIVNLASATPAAKPVQLASLGDESGHITGADALPGVRQTALFEIKRKSGIDDESDVDINEDGGGGSYQVASAAGLARLAPNGLLRQNESVDVACLKPSLVRVLKTIEGHFGRKMVVTSGYRDPSRNRRANGARNSLHMYCAAADIQVPGVSKWELANYVRSMPGRGGVGTYCHTESVHIDVGPERDWNWRCRRRSGGGGEGDDG